MPTFNGITVRPAEVGSVSHGTLRTEDLLEAFASELLHHIQRNANAWSSDAGRKERDRLTDLAQAAAEVTDYDSEEAAELVTELCDALQEFAPPDVAFGAHEGDGADFGYWPMEDTTT